jgi:hypothetical protein
VEDDGDRVPDDEDSDPDRQKRLEQKKLNGCKRASIHDITEPKRTAAAVVAAAQNEDEPGRVIVKPKAPGEPVGALEEFPGQYDLGPLFT